MSVHPGAIADTNLKRHFSLCMLFSLFCNLSLKSFWHFLFGIKMKSIQQGSATTLFATLSPNIVPGGYYEDCHFSLQLHPLAEDKILAKELWEVSEKAVAVAAK